MFLAATYKANRAAFEIKIDATTNTEGEVEAGANDDNDDGAVVNSKYVLVSLCISYLSRK